MRTGLMMTGLGAAIALAASSTGPLIGTSEPGERGSTKYNPRRASGSHPVAGGGNKEITKRVTRAVSAWTKVVHARGGEVGRNDVCAHLQEYWPDLSQPVWTAVLANFGF